jgi:Utp14 protein
MAAAFAGDDVVAEFEEQKADAAKETIQDVEDPQALPGWGTWANSKREPKCDHHQQCFGFTPWSWAVCAQNLIRLELASCCHFEACGRQDGMLKLCEFVQVAAREEGQGGAGEAAQAVGALRRQAEGCHHLGEVGQEVAEVHNSKRALPPHTEGGALVSTQRGARLRKWLVVSNVLAAFQFSRCRTSHDVWRAGV